MKESCFGQDSQGKKIESLLFYAFAWLRHEELRTYEQAVGDAGVYDAALLKFLSVADVRWESPVL